MGKIIIAIMIVLAISLPIACMTLITDSYGFSFVSKAHAEHDSRTIFEPKYPSGVISVSYTHLTLPTNREV